RGVAELALAYPHPASTRNRAFATYGGSRNASSASTYRSGACRCGKCPTPGKRVSVAPMSAPAAMPCLMGMSMSLSPQKIATGGSVDTRLAPSRKCRCCPQPLMTSRTLRENARAVPGRALYAARIAISSFVNAAPAALSARVARVRPRRLAVAREVEHQHAAAPREGGGHGEPRAMRIAEPMQKDEGRPAAELCPVQIDLTDARERALGNDRGTHATLNPSYAAMRQAPKTALPCARSCRRRR